jgi:signal peptidase II
VNKRAVFWVVFIGMLVVDQAVKAWIRQAIPVQGSFDGKPIPGIFELTLVYNEGIAFGLFQGLGFLLSPVAMIIAAGAGWYSWRHPKESVWSHIAMGLLASGALGNLYDRVVNKKVTDMFWFRLIHFPVFNVADSCITVATVLLILTWWSEAAKHKVEPTPEH